MKRWVLQICLFLVLGAIVNVAVAWTLPHFTRVRWSDAGPPTVEEVGWWQATAPAGHEVSKAPEGVDRHRGLGWQVVSMLEWRSRLSSSQAKGHTCSRKMFGWPMLSLQSTTWEHGGRIVAWRGLALFISKDWPSEPLWMGTIVNSILYGVMLSLPWMGILALWRRRRIKRGLCPKCAYPVGTSDKCTECGATVRPLNAA